MPRACRCYTHTAAARSATGWNGWRNTGIDGIDTLDPPPLGSVDLADAKRRVGKQVFFKGNIDAVNMLLKKSREEVRPDALARLKVGSPGGGYILSSACSVSPQSRPENLDGAGRGEQGVWNAAQRKDGFSILSIRRDGLGSPSYGSYPTWPRYSPRRRFHRQRAAGTDDESFVADSRSHGREQ